jgi:hypothetical protein
MTGKAGTTQLGIVAQLTDYDSLVSLAITEQHFVLIQPKHPPKIQQFGTTTTPVLLPTHFTSSQSFCSPN